MYLSNIKINDFRKFQELNLTFNKGLNLLVGENDSGKTAIIDAIKFVLGTHSNDWLRLEAEDFHVSNDERSKELTIVCTFTDFTEDEAAMFIEWLSIDAGKYYLKLTLKAKRKEGTPNIASISYDIKAGEDEESGVMSGEARNKLRIMYLKPLRDAEYELAPRKGSRLSQILANYDIFQTETGATHKLEDIAKYANNKIEQYFERDEGRDVSDIINENYLEAFSLKHNALSAKFSITETKLGRILERLQLKGMANGNDIGNIGLGSNNLLFIATEMLLLKDNNYLGLKLSLIEEIEAHLHPQAQLSLIDFLNKQSEELKLQSIITTHSNTLASKVDLDNLIICRNGNAFPLSKGETKLNSGDYEFLKRFLDDTKANLFFANGVIIVEGDAENLLIPSLAEFLGYPLHKYGVSIVNVGSTALLRYAKIFLRNTDVSPNLFDVPVAVVTDLDIKPKQYFTENTSETPKFYKITSNIIVQIVSAYDILSSNSIDFAPLTNNKYTSKTDAEADFKELIPKDLKVKTKAGKLLSDSLVAEDIDLDTDLPNIQNEELGRKDKSEQNVKYYIAPDWTLEYVLGLRACSNFF